MSSTFTRSTWNYSFYCFSLLLGKQMFSEIHISTSWQNNFWPKLHFLNNALTVHYELKETVEVTRNNNINNQRAAASIRRLCDPRLQPQSPEQQKPFPEWLLGKTMSHRKSAEFMRRYAHGDGAQFPSSPGQSQLIASANEWLGPIFYHSRIAQEERMKEGARGRER